MSCVVCAGSTRDGAFRVRVPERLYGKEACDECGPVLELLADRKLSKEALDRFLLAVEANGRQLLASQLRQVWEQGGAAETVGTGSAVRGLPPELAAIASTSGFDFDGYRIIAYLGFVSSEAVIGMGVFRAFTADFANVFGAESEQLGRKLAEAKTAAFLRLRKQVHDLGGNAIIGADLDYTMFGASLVGVIASGTAVFLERSDPS